MEGLEWSRKEALPADVHATSTDGTDDDRLLAPTVWTARLIVPVLLAAWAILYLFPGDTGRVWAWPVHPGMTALVMGGGYLAGAYFFACVSPATREPRGRRG